MGNHVPAVGFVQQLTVDSATKTNCFQSKQIDF